jgi:hypothetical protein
MRTGHSRGPLTRAVACLSLLVCLTALTPGEASAWGSEGHQITALVAYKLLTPRAQKNVLAVLLGKQIVDVAVWPDEVKRAGCAVPGSAGCNPEYRPETVQWHFVDIPFEEDTFNRNADYCRPSRYGDCIVPTVDDFKDILNRSTRRAFASNNDEQKRKLHDALAFLVHLLGDIHQPLHCAERNHDAGGNSVLITWASEPKYPFADIWNLHAVWDEYLVERGIKTMPAGKQTPTLYAAWLVGTLSPAQRDYAQLKSPTIEAGKAESVIGWAEGSHALAKTGAYRLPSQTVKTSTRGAQSKGPQGQPVDIVLLDEKYFTDNTPLVNRQLQLGGVRLARILNEIYDKDIPTN